jgi:predicted neuraminidase
MTPMNKLFLFLLVITIFSFDHAEPVVKNNFKMPVKEFLFGDDHPFPQCHASTLVRLKDGRFLSAWFGGTKEKADDVGIWITKGQPGQWTNPLEIAKIKNEPHWNPVLFMAPGGNLYLFFKVGKEIPDWQTYVMISSDDGANWSKPELLVAGDSRDRGPVRNKPIVLSNGVWLAGTSSEKGDWNVFFDRSLDQGKAWEKTPFIQLDRKLITGKGIIQPTIWESSPGVVHALLRSTAGFICRTDSKDYGKTWSPVYKTTLPNPNSAIDLSKLPDGSLVLAYNPDSKNWGSRGSLSLAISTDNGITWPKKIDVEAEKPPSEFSYPAVISFGDTIAMTYTWKRQKIVFWMGTKAEIGELK